MIVTSMVTHTSDWRQAQVRYAEFSTSYIFFDIFHYKSVNKQVDHIIGCTLEIQEPSLNHKTL